MLYLIVKIFEIQIKFFNFKKLDNFGATIIFPFLEIQKIFTKKIEKFKNYNSNINELNLKLLQLQKKYDELYEKNIELLETSDFFLKNKECIEFAARYKIENKLLVQIIYKNCDAENSYFLINAGTNAGVKVDMICVYKNCLIGKVVSVFNNFSKVITIFDKNTKISCVIKDENEFKNNKKEAILGIYFGDLLRPEVQFVPIFKTIKLGDKIISSGEGLVYPAGFELGVITELNSETQLNYKIIVQHSINLDKLNYCYLIKN